MEMYIQGSQPSWKCLALAQLGLEVSGSWTSHSPLGGNANSFWSCQELAKWYFKPQSCIVKVGSFEAWTSESLISTFHRSCFYFICSLNSCGTCLRTWECSWISCGCKISNFFKITQYSNIYKFTIYSTFYKILHC